MHDLLPIWDLKKSISSVFFKKQKNKKKIKKKSIWDLKKSIIGVLLIKISKKITIISRLNLK